VTATWKELITQITGGYLDSVSPEALALELEDLPPLWRIFSHCIGHYQRWFTGKGGRAAAVIANTECHTLQRLRALAAELDKRGNLTTLVTHVTSLAGGALPFPHLRDKSLQAQVRASFVAYARHRAASTRATSSRSLRLLASFQYPPASPARKGCNPLLDHPYEAGRQRLVTARLGNYFARAPFIARGPRPQCPICHRRTASLEAALPHLLLHCPGTVTARIRFMATAHRLCPIPPPQHPSHPLCWDDLDETGRLALLLAPEWWLPFLPPPPRDAAGRPQGPSPALAPLISAMCQFQSDITEAARHHRRG
jgi:hypothetical protein